MIKQIYNFKDSRYAFLLGITTLYLIYFVLLTWLSGSWHHPFQQFQQFWYWLIILGIGFGIQSVLFWYIRKGMHLNKSSSKLAESTSLGTSSFSMIACCAHHIVELIPFLGLSAFATVLTKYQSWFFVVGIISNIIGIYLMYMIIYKQSQINFLEKKHYEAKASC